MQKRERYLAAGVVGLLALVGGRHLFEQYNGWHSARRTRIQALEREISAKNLNIARGQLANRRLSEWESQSLPSNSELARSLYQNWLLTLVNQVKLSDANISLVSAPGRRSNYEKLAFTINGKGTLQQLTDFLFRFYSANHMHQIRRLTIKPAEGSKDLDLAISVEALSLPGAANRDKLNDQPAKRLASSDRSAYEKAIVTRNLFAEYVPPRPVAQAPRREEQPKPPAFDIAKFAIVTAIMEVGDRPQVWLHVRPTNQTLKLFEGDRFEVGAVNGTVLRIHSKDVELGALGKRLLVTLGESLRDGHELPHEDL